MSLKEQIKSFLNEHPESSLKDIYLAFSDKKQTHLRSVLNFNIKNGYFIRVKKGVYK
jgi:hypothetical protein